MQRGDDDAASHGIKQREGGALATANILKSEVSDGLVAPGFSAAAVAILSAKKKGAFILLEAAAGYAPPATELREVYGMAMCQRRNDVAITAGGSYPGWQAFAMRLRYPAVVDMAYSASPALGFYNQAVDPFA